ncbi:unnamed protein product [Diatraea saccharalis]|uniref:Regulatory protein zeste n=1 Tax=Diatraea saccharalis TaxID=40085 RepID=A0A9N9RAI7_9NEOP|nr:unnamed protein product [Diatraea saccharalis]
METKKRERSANFNSTEVQLLVSLVGINKLIIENKKTDAITNKDKESAWNKIETSFNSSWISSIERSWKTLKLKYEGVKKGTKNKSSIQRQEMYRTGGGPSNAPEFTDVEGKVMSICSNIKGLDARHDSDTIKSVPISISDMVIMDVDELRGSETPNNAEDIVHISIPDINESLTFEQTDDIKIIDNETHKDMNESFTADQKNFYNKNDNLSEKENRWDKWHPKALKSRVSNDLKTDTATKRSVTSKLDELSSARLELVQIQMETARKEQKHQEEEHKLKMQHQANDE